MTVSHVTTNYFATENRTDKSCRTEILGRRSLLSILLKCLSNGILDHHAGSPYILSSECVLLLVSVIVVCELL